MNPKKIRFIVDMGVSKKVEEWLSTNDYDIKVIRDIDPRMKDRDVLKLAVTEKRMVITMDKDFGELVFNSGLNHSGVLLLRLDNILVQLNADIEAVRLSHDCRLIIASVSFRSFIYMLQSLS